MELRALLSEARSFLAGETLDEEDLARVTPLRKAALAQINSETRDVVDHFAWRAARLCVLVCLVTLVCLFFGGRFVVGRAK